MWYMVYESATGRAISCGTVLADPMPEAYAVANLGDVQPDFGQVQWNPQTLALEPLPSS
jgi:hypothetical protein